MQTFKIRVINSDFESNNEIKAVSFEDARKQGLRAALTIGVDEVCGGAHLFGAEVVVDGDGDDLERFMVGMGQIVRFRSRAMSQSALTLLGGQARSLT